MSCVYKAPADALILVYADGSFRWGFWEKSAYNPCNARRFYIRKRSLLAYTSSLQGVPTLYTQTETFAEGFWEKSVYNPTPYTQNDAFTEDFWKRSVYNPTPYTHTDYFTGASEKIAYTTRLRIRKPTISLRAFEKIAYTPLRGAPTLYTQKDAFSVYTLPVRRSVFCFAEKFSSFTYRRVSSAIQGTETLYSKTIRTIRIWSAFLPPRRSPCAIN